MCGINGLIGFLDSKGLIRTMNDTISHRGPDAEGEWFDQTIALGHRRLSIIDLSLEANQPFVKGNLVIVYNGEVYNFLELRQKLLSEGAVFRTNSDTEVVLELFRLYREKSFDKLVGMFSFCIYDMDTKEVFLVRDYFGIKPLYYTQNCEGRFAFSSELKALIRLPGINKDINQKALVSCMNYQWVYGNGSIFKEIKQVPPAHYLYLRLMGEKIDIKLNRYWELKPSRSNLTEEGLKERLKDILENSIKRHLVSDVPVGAFLSGGLDSSLISVIAKKLNNNLSTYTISIGDRDKRIEKMPDDNFYAKKVSAAFCINHTDMPIKPDVINYLNNIVYMLDEPIGDPAAINTYLICKAAKERGIKVLLSGMGADEVFAGYRRHYATLLANKLNSMPSPVKNSIKAILNYMPVRLGPYGIKQTRWAKRLFSFIDMPIDMAYMRSYSYYNKDELSRLFDYNLSQEINDMYSHHREIFYHWRSFDDINRMCYTDINMFMTGLNLAYTDRASMASSVEVRVPFIDKEVIEFAMSLQGEYKINKGVLKYILKKAATDYLPRDIVYRPKASFGMPIRAWVSCELREMVDELLSESAIKKRGLFNYKYIREIIAQDRKGLSDNAYRIYQLLTLELWFRRFIDG